jgi:menaquinone-dependent protoporphyrinogen IX oxidase
MGAGVRAGRIPKDMFKFITQNEKTLLTKKIAFFLCCAEPEQFNAYVENNIPKDLRSVSITSGNFGGSLELSRFQGFEKLIVRIIRSSIKNKEESDDESENRTLPGILPENIQRFADQIKIAYKQK